MDASTTCLPCHKAVPRAPLRWPCLSRLPVSCDGAFWTHGLRLGITAVPATQAELDKFGSSSDTVLSKLLFGEASSSAAPSAPPGEATQPAAGMPPLCRQHCCCAAVGAHVGFCLPDRLCALATRYAAHHHTAATTTPSRHHTTRSPERRHQRPHHRTSGCRLVKYGYGSARILWILWSLWVGGLHSCA